MSQEAQTKNDDYINEEEEEDEDESPKVIIPPTTEEETYTLDELIEGRKKDEILIKKEKDKIIREQHVEELKTTFNQVAQTNDDDYINEEEEEEEYGFNPTSNAINAIIDDYQTYRDTPKENLSFTAGPDGNNLFTWNVFITKFPPGSDLEKDMKKYKKNAENYHGIELRVHFPPDYPIHPPFVHVIRPRFQFHTGRVTVGGSLCMEILTDDKWAPMSLLSLLTTIVTDIFAGKPRINLDSVAPYSLEEAKKAYVRVANDHGWNPSWIPK